MHVLDKRIQKYKRNPLAFLLGLVLACGVFVAMGLTQLNIDFTPPDEPEPLLEFHLPPPPPPPQEQKVPPKKTAISINFNLPAVSGPADVPLGFLDVDFGLTPKELTKSQVNVDDTIDDYETDGLEDLTVYDYKDVTEKPQRTFRPPLDLSAREIGSTKNAFEVTYIVHVTSKGRPADVHIVDCPYPEAIPKLKRWIMDMRFRPAKKDGKPVACVVRNRMTYRPSSGNLFSI